MGEEGLSGVASNEREGLLRPITGQDLVDVRPKLANGQWRPFKTIEGFLGMVTPGEGEPQERSLEARKRFLDLLKFPEFHEMKLQEKADATGVSISTISKWMVQVPDSYLAEALKVSRERSASRSLEVDASLMRQCREGNVKAMDLYYRRIEGWAPKTGMELTRGVDPEMAEKDDKALLVALMQGLSEEERAEVVKRAGSKESSG